MKAKQPLKRAVYRTLLAGGIAIAGLGLASGTAQAEPDLPIPDIGELGDLGGMGGMGGISSLMEECGGICQQLVPVVMAELPMGDILELTGGLGLG